MHGTSNGLNDQLRLYPNPSEEGTVTLDHLQDFGSLQVVDMAGKVVLKSRKMSGSKLELDISELSEGIYMIQLKGEAKRQTLKLLVAN